MSPEEQKEYDKKMNKVYLIMTAYPPGLRYYKGQNGLYGGINDVDTVCELIDEAIKIREGG
jgi:hypothetical protein